MPHRPRPRRLAALLLLAWVGTWLVNRSLVAVRGPSMLPTLTPGTRLLTLPASLQRPTPGRVVVVEDPHEAGHRVVKRVTRLGPRTVVVHGDNPAASTDSRAWGPLPLEAVRRVVVARWPSLSRTGLSLVLLLGATLLAAAPVHASTADGSPPAELQQAPEDGQEQFGQPSDERTEQVTRLLRNVLGGIVAVVILLIVIVLPLKLRNRGADEHDASPGAGTGT